MAETPTPSGQGRPVDRSLDRSLRGAGRHEDAAVRRQLAILRLARRDLVRELAAATAGSFRLFHLETALAAVDALTARYRPQAVDAGRADAAAAYTQGQASVDRVLAVVDLGDTLADLAPELLQAIVEVTTDQVQAVWTELGTSLRGAVRRASLGITDPFDAMRAIMRSIRDPKTFGTVATRAETIIRTEVNRTFELASDQRMRQANERLGGTLRKTWLAVGRNTRAAHLSAGARYAARGSPGPIPVDEPFIVGGESMMFPLDPRASPGNVINCRCKSVPYVEDVT